MISIPTRIEWNMQNRTITTSDELIDFTPKEFQFLSLLRDGHPVSYDEFSLNIYHQEVNSKTHMALEKRADRIRKKLFGTELYIYCILEYGYILLPNRRYR